MVDWNGAYIHPAYKTHRKLKCTSPFCGRVDNIATGVTDTCSMCSSEMIPIDEINCPSCGREMYNDNCLWCEEDPPEDPPSGEPCRCEKEPVVEVVVAGRGELNWACPDCRKVYGNWKPVWLRETPTKESKTEYKMKCKYCGDVQILNKKSFDDVLLNGCDKECWECLKQGYEPVIIKEPKDNSLPPCCDCIVDESSCEHERVTCKSQQHYKSSTEVREKEEK